MKLHFTKMQAAGNDYVYLDCRAGGLPTRKEAAALAVRLSRRRFSVGGDGIILIGPPLLADGDAAMYIYNADGSEGAMCGNGVRCVAEYLYTHGVRRGCIQIDTPQAGRKTLHRVAPQVWQAGMGHFTARADVFPAVGLGRGLLLGCPLTAAGKSFTVDCIHVGNPHCVVSCETLPTAAQLAVWGAAIEKHPAFPAGVNVEFVRVVSPGCLQASVWERGSGATLACGTGA
ncbi:MAG: diaminopimelate epimerase, partial [Gemmiger sp.]|uniref:diaminopimelate epimerase n=1 Tax=Gemmiger sp. TaxID=2049027 RepID=UPI002A91E08D